MLRDRISAELKTAMKEGDKLRKSTLRLVSAAIRDREIAQRTENAGGAEDGISDEDVTAILAKMIRQRQDSARAYEEAGRIDAADEERAEIKVIQEFLPRQLTPHEAREAIRETIAQIGASSIRDMGRIMAALKARYAGQMDFAQAGSMIKEALTN